MHRHFYGITLAYAVILACPISTWSAQSQVVLQDPATEAPRSNSPPHRLALGVNYLGGQSRWYFGPKWAGEIQFQTGKSSSDYGDVTASVVGLRAYRTFKNVGRMAWYIGPEIAYASASSHSASYKISGIVVGGFGGFDYYLSHRFSVGLDIGPYVISLKEQQTGVSQTNLDFILNTALNWHLF